MRQHGVWIRTLAVGYTSGTSIPSHSHGWDQLIFASDGVMTVQTAQGAWVVPPHRAVWVPSGVEHAVHMSGFVSMRTLYFVEGLVDTLPEKCCVVQVSPLLRELIRHAVDGGPLDSRKQAHLIGVILEQMRRLPVVPLHLPWPQDRRARSVADTLREDPGDTRSLASLCHGVGASKRTIERLFHDETGMTFGQWRKQARLMRALPLLAAGESVTRVALDVGYDSTSAFISMFKSALGTTPGRYY